jgi:hypothetical protein
MWKFVFARSLHQLKFNCSLTVPAWLCILSSLVSAQTLVRVTELVSGLSQPTAMAFIGANDLLVLQKGDGRVRRIINGVFRNADCWGLQSIQPFLNCGIANRLEYFFCYSSRISRCDGRMRFRDHYRNFQQHRIHEVSEQAKNRTRKSSE